MDPQVSVQPQQPSRRILIVEDERPMAGALEFKFNQAGFAATAVYDGEQAFEELQQHEYDFLLLDLIMPRVDGYTLIAKLKEFNVRIPPFIIISNLSQKSDLEMARKLGAVDYIIKANFSVTDIVNLVKLNMDTKQPEPLPS